MSFSRTPNGISNYNHFFGKKIVFIEGAINKNICIDQIYYESILSALEKYNNYKIKPVGSKCDVINHLDSVKNNNGQYLAIVDKDLMGLTCSQIASNGLYSTYFYSWENELWSYKLCEDVIDSMTITGLTRKFKIIYEKTLKAAAYLSSLDNALQIHCENVLPKNGRSCGIAFAEKGIRLIPSSEIRRIRDGFTRKRSNCSIENYVLRQSFQHSPEGVINGHLWENISIHLINRGIKDDIFSKGLPNEAIKRAAVTKFTKSPLDYLSPNVILHYSAIFV